MTYQSLYRKYRPSKFSEVYGQNVAKTILKNAIISQKIAHAYLFFGPRGTGKTSLAKMFARMCNCNNPIDGDCCNKCENCIESSQKNCVDIIEIDAASNNGVDEIRELKNKINLVSSKLKYKVYIIDEVHMLSTGAFNALLKTLEEPPSHVIFILATTEYYKVPETIISRCQCIEFKNIDDESMRKRLTEISKLEKINISENAINEIVRNSNGGMRDAIGLLDKINSYTLEKKLIEIDDVKESLGLISENELQIFIDDILNKNLDILLNKIKKYADSGKDIPKFVNDLIYFLRNKIINDKKYELIDLLNKLNELHKNFKNSYNQKIVFEMFVVEFCLNSYNSESKQLTQKIDKKKQLVDNVENENIVVESSNKRILNQKNIDIRINNSFVDANKNELNNCKKQWKALEIHSFDTKNGSLVCDLQDTIPVVTNTNYLVVCSQYDSLTNKINESSNEYEKILRDILSINKYIVAVNSSKWDSLKEEYLKNVKAGKKYELIELNDSICDNNDKINDRDLYNEAKNLFGEIVSKEE